MASYSSSTLDVFVLLRFCRVSEKKSLRRGRGRYRKTLSDYTYRQDCNVDAVDEIDYLRDKIKSSMIGRLHLRHYPRIDSNIPMSNASSSLPPPHPRQLRNINVSNPWRRSRRARQHPAVKRPAPNSLSTSMIVGVVAQIFNVPFPPSQQNSVACLPRSTTSRRFEYAVSSCPPLV